jgi:F0F1-type ATP synthase membrane subunit b/b'
MFQGTAGRVAGVGLALAATLLVAKYWRPVVKTAIKGYLTATDRIREMTAEAGEGMQDLVAEAKAEHEKARGPVIAQKAVEEVQAEVNPSAS